MIDNARFIVGAARLLASPKLNGPYEACITRYGDQEQPETVVVSIVDIKRHLVIDHRTWFIAEYCDKVFRTIDCAMDALADDMMDYCERSRVGKVFMIDKQFPLREYEERCPSCGGERVRVPWPDR